MRKKIILAGALLGVVALSVGCDKNIAKVPPQSSEQTFNAVQLFRDFESAPPELGKLADKAWKSIQCGSFSEALKYLGQLEANPTLNDAQKKSVTDLIERVKRQVATNAAVR